MKKRIWIATAVLALTFGARSMLSAAAPVPLRKSLVNVPRQIDGYRGGVDEKLTDEIQGVLKADDYLIRDYSRPGVADVGLFIAYYRTQRAGESMHSPKNCMPGWGWEITSTDEIPLTSSASGKQVKINRYIIEKQGQKALMLYWYQAQGSVIANEYAGKVYLVWNALRTGRRDGAIVRFVVPVNGSVQQATDQALEFARAVYPQLSEYLPN
jgi:EpsI family protein